MTEPTSTPEGFVRVDGTEARVCHMIASRQALGIKKYGTTVANNPLTHRQWLQHALEESLDLAIYLQRTIEEIDAQEQKPCE